MVGLLQPGFHGFQLYPAALYLLSHFLHKLEAIIIVTFIIIIFIVTYFLTIVVVYDGLHLFVEHCIILYQFLDVFLMASQYPVHLLDGLC